MNSTLTRTLVSGLLAATILTTAGGCFLLPTSPPTAAAPTPTESASPSESPTPTPEPREAATCESAINAATITSWEGDGVIENPNFVQKLHDENLALKDFADFGGIICQWGFENAGATAIYGYSKISEADMIAWQNHLGDDLGADVSVYADNNLYSITQGEFADGPEFYLFSPGPTDYFWMYAWSPDLFDEMLANIPNP